MKMIILLFLLTLFFISCKGPAQTIVDEALQDSRNVCYGDFDRLFPGISACSYINLLDEDVNTFLCFPYQMFRYNCSWQPASEWLGICRQPMTYNNFHNDVIFCYRKSEDDDNPQTQEPTGQRFDLWLLRDDFLCQ